MYILELTNQLHTKKLFLNYHIKIKFIRLSNICSVGKEIFKNNFLKFKYLINLIKINLWYLLFLNPCS